MLNAHRHRRRRRARAGELSQTSATSATNSIDDSQNRSVAAIVKACWSTMRLSSASACSRLWPARCRSASACTAAGFDRLSCSARLAWCSRARLSHSVVKTEVPTAPAVMRTKLLRPAAAGMRCGCRPEKAIDCSGMKNIAMAMPCSSVGSRMVPKSAWVLNSERIHRIAAKPRKAAVASQRGSMRLTFLPTQGDSTMASSPTGAIARPAQVAV